MKLLPRHIQDQPSMFSFQSFRFLPALLTLLLLAGCATTALTPQEPLPNIESLASVNEKTIGVSVSSQVTDGDSIGSQYLFVVFPFGRVELSQPEQHFGVELYEQLVVRGFQPVQVTDDSTDRKHLKVIIDKVQATAYDFFFGRRVSATVELRIGMYSPTIGQVVYVPVKESSGEFRRYGFKQQLEKALRESIYKAIANGLDALNFPSPPRPHGRLDRAREYGG